MHILLPKLVKSVLESVGGRCFDDMLMKLISVSDDFLAEEHSNEHQVYFMTETVTPLRSCPVFFLNLRN